MAGLDQVFRAGQRRLMVVAHPDDETLFGAGILLRYPGDWTVHCCSVPRADPVRAYKFFGACEALGVKPRLWPWVEPPVTDMMDPQGVDLGDFDLVVTHGREGEYGHRHHRSVFEWCAERVDGLVSFSGEESFELNDAEIAARYVALNRYDHIHPYPPLGTVTKCEALRHRHAEHLAEKAQRFEVHGRD